MATVSNFEVELLTQQYSTNVELLLQQKNTRLRSTVRTGSHVGKQASPVQYIGPVQFKQAGARGSQLVVQTVGYQRRWVSPADKDLTVQVDQFDELRTIIDPKSPLSSVVMAAGQRLFDDVLIAAFFDTAKIGEVGATTETFDSGANFPISVSIADTYGAGAATGLTVAKLLEAKRILRRYENDLEGVTLHIAIGAQQEKDLLQQIEIVSTEFNDRPVLVNGRLEQFLGFTIHHSERLQVSGSGATADRLIPVWMEDGMYLGMWKDMQTIISQRNDLTGHPWQAYSMCTLGATRLQGGKVLKISCLEPSASADITI